MKTVVFFYSFIRHFKIYKSDSQNPTYQAIQSEESDAQLVLVMNVLNKLKYSHVN